MERMSGVKAERLADWNEAASGRDREAALLADLDAGFVVPGRKALVVVTASDVLGSRAHHPQPMAQKLERGLRSSRRAGTGHGGRSSPAGPRRARWLADREYGRRRIAGDGQAFVCGRQCGSRAAARSGPDVALRGRARQAGARQGGWKHMVGPPHRGRAGDPDRRQGARQTHQPAPPAARGQASSAGVGLREIRCAFSLFHDDRSGEGHPGRPG